MKPKTLKLTAFLLIFAGIFTACNGKEYPFLNIDKTMITAPAEGGTFTILVSSNGEWTALVQDAENNSWLTQVNASGINDGVITVNVAENTLFTSRSAKVKISMGSLSKYVVVEQEVAEVIFPIEIPFTGFLFKEILRERHPVRIIVINSNEELKNYITCNDFPDVDFATQALLLTFGISNNIPVCDIFVEIQQVSTNDFVVNFEVLNGGGRAFAWWKTAFLIPKIDSDATIALDIQQRQSC